MKRMGMLFVGTVIGLASLPAWAGSIAGSVNFSGEPYKEGFAITKNPEVCGKGTREVEWVRTIGGKLSQAVVYIEKIVGPKKWSDAAAAPKSNQKGCAFIPYLQVVQNGAEVEILNSDPVLHNIHTYEIIGRAKRTIFNVSQPEKGFIFKEKVKLKRGKWMKLECDAHDFMHAWAFAARNPYYSVTGDDGKFSITDVPPGEYKLTAYHPTLGKQKATVTVGDGAASADFTFSE